MNFSDPYNPKEIVDSQIIEGSLYYFITWETKDGKIVLPSWTPDIIANYMYQELVNLYHAKVRERFE